jgi:hypothetical protein
VRIYLAAIHVHRDLGTPRPQQFLKCIFPSSDIINARA